MSTKLAAITEADVEAAALEWFQELGYALATG